jgi:hypothetical protein
METCEFCGEEFDVEDLDTGHEEECPNCGRTVCLEAGWTDRKFEHVFCRYLQNEGDEQIDELLNAIREVRTFADAGLLTRDRGIVVTLDDGTEMQLTIVERRRSW